MDDEVVKWREDIKSGKNKYMKCVEEGVIRMENRIYMPNKEELKREILEEVHCSTYAMHPGSTKMYRNLKEICWWKGMKNDIANYVSKCLTCQ